MADESRPMLIYSRSQGVCTDVVGIVLNQCRKKVSRSLDSPVHLHGVLETVTYAKSYANGPNMWRFLV